MPKLTMPPSVLPTVARARVGQKVSGKALRTANNTASDPPGSRVAARKLLMKSEVRLAVSVTGMTE